MVTLDSLTCDGTIEYPRSVSEFELQANLYHRLRQLGFDTRGEVSARNENSSYRRKGSRFDLVVFREGRAVCIIETKPRPIGEYTANYSVKAMRYPHYGVPVFFVGPGDVDEVVAAVRCL